MEQKNAITHSVSGLKNKMKVLLKIQNDVTWSLRSAQLYLRVCQMGLKACQSSVRVYQSGLRACQRGLRA